MNFGMTVFFEHSVHLEEKMELNSLDISGSALESKMHEIFKQYSNANPVAGNSHALLDLVSLYEMFLQNDLYKRIDSSSFSYDKKTQLKKLLERTKFAVGSHIKHEINRVAH